MYYWADAELWVRFVQRLLLGQLRFHPLQSKNVPALEYGGRLCDVQVTTVELLLLGANILCSWTLEVFWYQGAKLGVIR